jgi:hypothetical protein
MPPRVVPVPGVKASTARGVAYLIWPEDADVTAQASIDRLAKSDGTDKAKVWARFDHWVDGNVHDKYFHRWNEVGFEHTFVFKWNKGGKDKGMQRLYGVLFHPKPKANPGFEVCVLFTHALKEGKKTDPQHKNKAEQLFKNADVVAAVKKQYPDE